MRRIGNLTMIEDLYSKTDCQVHNTFEFTNKIKD